QYIWRGLAQISELARNIKYVLSTGPDGLTVEGFELTDDSCELTGKDETLLSLQTLNGICFPLSNSTSLPDHHIPLPRDRPEESSTAVSGLVWVVEFVFSYAEYITPT